MASRSDIEAGKAHVRLYVKNSELMKGLKSVGSSLTTVGQQVMKVGAALAAVGSAAVAGLAKAFITFTKMGSELADLSAKTGIAASKLAELKYAAEQSGSGLDAVEKSSKKLNSVLADAFAGGEAANKALAAVGLTADELKDQLPYEQLRLVGEALSKMPNVTLRNAAALDLLGKSGVDLVPMFRELQALSAEAQELGLVPADESVAAAARIGDAMDKLRSVFLAAVFEIGAALAPVFEPALVAVTKLAAATVKWIRENGGVVRTALAIGAALATAGALLIGIGGTLATLGFALTGIVTLVTTLGTFFAAVLSPVGLIVIGVLAIGAALVAAIGYWALFTASGKAAVGAIMAAFQPLADLIKKTIGGIGDALMAGDLQLAAKIAAKGIEATFLKALGMITQAIGDLAARFYTFVKSLPPAVRAALAGAGGEWALDVGMKGITAADAAVDARTARLQAELGELRKEAAAAAERAKMPPARQPDVVSPSDPNYVPGGGNPAAELKARVVGFNPNQLLALMNNGAAKDPFAREAERTNLKLDRLIALTEKIAHPPPAIRTKR